jgi:hypothetical protein
MSPLFPHANLVAGVMVLLVGFLFHWVGQLVSLFNWDFATRIGLQDKGAPPEFLIYERGTAAADAAIGWIYGLAGVGLILDAPWGFTLAWFPGVILIYHSISAWFWYGNQMKAGYALLTDPKRSVWCLANLATGLLAVAVAWAATGLP